MSDGRQRARTYTRAGLRTLPVSPETKRPRMKGFDDLAFDAYRHVKPDDMVAILCGPCPALGATPEEPLAGDWLCCIDLDGDLDPIGLADALGAELPDTLSTHDGKHLWYRVEPGTHRDRLKQWNGVLGLRKGWAGDGKAPDADVRWCGGYAREHKEDAEAFDVDQIAVLPAETVEAIIARRPYDNRESDPLGPTRDLDGDAVERLVEALVPAWPEDGEGRHDAFLGLGGMLRRQGVSLRSAKQVARAIQISTDSDRSRVKDSVDSWTRADAGLPAYGWTELARHLHVDADTLLEAIDDATADPWLTSLLAQGWPPPRPPEPVAADSAQSTGGSAEAALAALPDWASAHVRAAQEELRTPLDLNLVNALGVIACAASGRLKLRLTPTYTCHTCLFVCSVADPGQLKSPAFRVAAAPIKAWVAEQQDEERDALEQRRMKREKLEADVRRLAKAWVDGYDNDPNAPEAAELREKRLLLEAAPAPTPLEFLVQDATPEALSDLLATHGRIACLSSDASKIFSILGGQYSKGQADLGVWLEAYDGEMKEVHRVGREAVKPQHTQTTLSAVLSIQPEVLERVTGNAAMVGEGLVQRFCWAVCSSTGPRWAPGEQPTPVPPNVAETWNAGVRFVLSMPVGTEVSLSDGARAVYTAFRDELEARMQPNGDLAGDMRGWASKHLERCARIAALLWACDGAEGKSLGAEHMARAVTIAQWLVPHALRAMQGNDHTGDEQAVLRWVGKTAEKLHSDAHAWIRYADLTKRLTPKRLRINTDKVLKPLLRDLVGRGALEATFDPAAPKYRLPQ